MVKFETFKRPAQATGRKNLQIVGLVALGLATCAIDSGAAKATAVQDGEDVTSIGGFTPWTLFL